MVFTIIFFLITSLVSSFMSWTLATHALQQREKGEGKAYAQYRNRSLLWFSFAVISAVSLTVLLKLS